MICYRLHREEIQQEKDKTLYRKEQLELMTTHQLREICRREKLVQGLLNPLDKEELIHVIMRYRGLLFCSLSGAIRFAVAKRNRRLRRRFSRGCATTNAIVLMTLLSKCPRTFSKQYHKYRRSPRGRRSPCTPSKTSSVLSVISFL